MDTRTAYHGSSQVFDRFSFNSIGTGTGAQSRGWGIYFASEKLVAEWYRDHLSRQVVQTPTGEKTVSEFSASLKGVSLQALSLVVGNGGDFAKSKKMAREWGENSEYMAAIESLEKEVTFVYRSGNIYQTNIPKDENLLDWDKPLNDQPSFVRERLKDIIDYLLSKNITEQAKEKLCSGVATGENVYTWLVGEMVIEHDTDIPSAKRLASEALYYEGIPGLRYLDKESRKQGAGSYNYVIWDPLAMEIESRNNQKISANVELLQNGNGQNSRADGSIASRVDDNFADRAAQFKSTCEPAAQSQGVKFQT